MISVVTENDLKAAALAVRERAYSPYSKFKVGAALLADDLTIVTGCNVENASYGLTNCAERTALFAGVAQGVRKYRAICIATDTPTPTPPCGACRQVIWELAGDIEVLLVNLDGVERRMKMSTLLPEAFDMSFLNEETNA